MNRITKLLGMDTVQKKILVLSKLAGAMIVAFYVFTAELSPDRNISFWGWFALLAVVIVGLDFMLNCLVSKPLKSINKVAGQMAELDFSSCCDTMSIS